MSTLITDNFQERATGDSVGAKYLVRGSAKSWANLNGTGTIALRDSLNVSSVVDNGTGDYSFNLTSAMANANFNIVGHADDDSFIMGAGQVAVEVGTRIRAVAGPRVLVARYTGSSNTRTAADMEFVDFSTQGDLA